MARNIMTRSSHGPENPTTYRTRLTDLYGNVSSSLQANLSTILPYTAITAIILLAVSGIHQPYISPAPSEDPAYRGDIIVISVNVLRPDHMPCYGYHRNTTPNICSVASDGIIFDQAVSQTTWSLPAYASLFTSQYPSVHGIARRESIPERETLPVEVLRSSGYSTGAFVGSVANHSGQLKPAYGFDQGFDTYHAQGHLFTDTIPPAKKWLSAHKRNRTFLFLQGQNLHPPWHYPGDYDHLYDDNYTGVLHQNDIRLHFDATNETRVLDDIRQIDGEIYLYHEGERIPLDERDLDHIRAHYDGGARYTDMLVGQFIRWLKDSGMYANTTLIITGDHGTNVGNEQEGRPVIGHGYRPFEDQIRIPFIIKPSERMVSVNGRVSSQVGLIDLLPTVLDITGETPDEHLMQGESIAHLIRAGEGGGQTRHIFSESRLTDSEAVRTDEWKLIHTPRARGEDYLLYNLRRDPREANNLYGQKPGIASTLKEKLRQWEKELDIVRTEKHQVT